MNEPKFQYIVPPTDSLPENSWLAVKRGHERGHEINLFEEENILRETFYSTQLWLIDLDGTLADPTAKSVVKNAVGVKGRHLNPRYWIKAIKTGLDYWLDDQDVAVLIEGWHDYVSSFLQDERSAERLNDFLTPQRVGASLYPGVMDLASLISDSGAASLIVTRNIPEIAAPYVRLLGFTGYQAGLNNDKGKIVKDILQARYFKTVGVLGNSVHDGEMIEAAESRRRRVTGFCVMQQPDLENVDPRFDYALGPNFSALVQVLQRQSNDVLLVGLSQESLC